MPAAAAAPAPTPQPAPTPPPMPAPAPPVMARAVTPLTIATQRSSSAGNTEQATTAGTEARKTGRSSLRIPLLNSGGASGGTGLNVPQ